MKKIINAIPEIVTEMLDGLRKWLEENGVKP